MPSPMQGVHPTCVFSVELKLVQPDKAWFSSLHDDRSDPMELCVAMLGPIYHWLWYEQNACASGVPMTPQP